MSDKQFIPERPEELTAQWLTQVLTENGYLAGSNVLDIQQRILGDGAGFVGDIVQLLLTLDAPADIPPSIIAKMPKLENRVMGELLGAYERENMFYMTLSDDLPVATPKMYYGEFDRDASSEKQEEILRQADKIPNFLQGPMTKLAWWIAGRKKRRYILLMEDVSDATPFDQLAGVERSQMQQILEATAQLHAHFWEQPLLHEQFWLLPFDIDAKMRQQMMVRSKGAFAELFGDVLDDGLERFVEDVAEQGVAVVRELNQGPTTLMHGDLRLDNLFTRNDEVLFIDWQLVRRGPPAYDIAYLLSSGLQDSESASELLQGYHEALCRAGVANYSFDELWRDYRLGLKAVLMNLSSVDQVDLGDGRGNALLHKWIQRLHQRLVADN